MCVSIEFQLFHQELQISAVIIISFLSALSYTVGLLIIKPTFLTGNYSVGLIYENGGQCRPNWLTLGEIVVMTVVETVGEKAIKRLINYVVLLRVGMVKKRRLMFSVLLLVLSSFVVVVVGEAVKGNLGGME